MARHTVVVVVTVLGAATVLLVFLGAAAIGRGARVVQERDGSCNRASARDRDNYSGRNVRPATPTPLTHVDDTWTGPDPGTGHAG